MSGLCPAVQIALEKVRTALANVGDSFDQVPDEWWVISGIRPEQIRESLLERMDALPNLINVTQWGGGFTGGEFNNIPIIQL
jgi:hypothetical protein